MVRNTVAMPLRPFNGKDLRGISTTPVALRHNISNVPVVFTFQKRNAVVLTWLLGGRNMYGGSRFSGRTFSQKVLLLLKLLLIDIYWDTLLEFFVHTLAFMINWILHTERIWKRISNGNRNVNSNMIYNLYMHNR